MVTTNTIQQLLRGIKPNIKIKDSRIKKGRKIKKKLK